jgi:hypothetical protein
LPWTLAYGHREDRSPIYGCEPTREGRDGSVRQKLAAGGIAIRSPLQVVLSAGLALPIDNHFRVVLGARRTTCPTYMPCSPGRLITGRGAIVGLDSHAPGLDLSAMSLHPLAAEFIASCLPSKTDKLPSGSGWLHEIKHDGFRIIARKRLARLRSRSRLIDGEAVAALKKIPPGWGRGGIVGGPTRREGQVHRLAPT